MSLGGPSAAGSVYDSWVVDDLRCLWTDPIRQSVLDWWPYLFGQESTDSRTTTVESSVNGMKSEEITEITAPQGSSAPPPPRLSDYAQHLLGTLAQAKVTSIAV